MILDGTKVRDALLEEYKSYIEKNNLKLCLGIILIGEDGPSKLYVSNKLKYAKYIGIDTKLITLSDNALNEDILKEIDSLNNDPSVTGIILQCPVPDQIDLDLCISHINPLKDIDGFTKENTYNLMHNLKGLKPCTVKGIMKLFDYYNIELKGKKVCMVGRGSIVGRPLTLELINKDATVTVCHSKTLNLKEETLNSDIIISATGKGHLITEDMVKNGAIVIDVGIDMSKGSIMGDVDFDNVKGKCSFITPNPKGVGPMTIAMIMENVIKAGEMQDE